jgi:hypothetical protein
MLVNNHPNIRLGKEFTVKELRFTSEQPSKHKIGKRVYSTGIRRNASELLVPSKHKIG